MKADVLETVRGDEVRERFPMSAEAIPHPASCEVDEHTLMGVQ